MKKLILIPAVAVLTACSSVVEDKYYLPSYERTHSECVQWGNSECENTQELKIKVPECWRLKVQYDTGRESYVCVPEEKWKETYIGQEWKPE